MILKVVYSLLVLVTNIYGIYFLIKAMPLFFKKQRRCGKAIKQHYFEILIPARNEEMVIGNLIKSLQKLNYDKSRYEITVVLNNSTDRTKEIASSYGVNLMECETSVSCKGDALKEAFSRLTTREEIDAYLILDADNVIDSDFLIHMNHSLNNGYQVAQGFRDTKNAGDNWISSSYAIYYYIQNYFFNKTNALMGYSSSINGTGFVVKKEVIDQIGFDTKTLKEDIEFAGICALHNIKIDFVEKAITYDEQPTGFKVSWIQRKRWSKGSMQCLWEYTFRLFKNIKNNLSCLDLFMMYIAPFMQILTVLCTIFSICMQFISKGFTYKGLVLSICFLVIAYIAQVFLCIFTVFIHKKKIKKYLGGILLFPVFILSWIPINLIILFQKNIKWQSIPHNRNIAIDEL